MSDQRPQDQWAQWLLHRRHGGDLERHQMMLERLAGVRDRVLDNARVEAGDVVVDVGCGDGLLGFGAIDRVGDSGKVIFSDISQDLLEQCRAVATQAKVLDRTSFLVTPADDLSPIETESVDVITTRSVLIYVDDKRASFVEFHRVLRPGGRLSIFEPINRFHEPEPQHRFGGYDMSPIPDIAKKVRNLYEQLQPLDTDPMLNFDERDLLALSEEVGFRETHLEYRADITSPEPMNWQAMWQSSGNPKIPTLEEAVSQALTAEEAEVFVKHLRPKVEKREGVQHRAVAYLWAVK